MIEWLTVSCQPYVSILYSLITIVIFCVCQVTMPELTNMTDVLDLSMFGIQVREAYNISLKIWQNSLFRIFKVIFNATFLEYCLYLVMLF